MRGPSRVWIEMMGKWEGGSEKLPQGQARLWRNISQAMGSHGKFLSEGVT